MLYQAAVSYSPIQLVTRLTWSLHNGWSVVVVTAYSLVVQNSDIKLAGLCAELLIGLNWRVWAACCLHASASMLNIQSLYQLLLSWCTLYRRKYYQTQVEYLIVTNFNRFWFTQITQELDQYSDISDYFVVRCGSSRCAYILWRSRLDICRPIGYY